MSGYLIDTDVLIDFFKKRPYALAIIESHASRHELSVSILTVAELAGELRYAYKIKGVSLPTVDTLIAATAITNGHTLVTRNIKDYPMPELHLYTFQKNN